MLRRSCHGFFPMAFVRVPACPPGSDLWSGRNIRCTIRETNRGLPAPADHERKRSMNDKRSRNMGSTSSATLPKNRNSRMAPAVSRTAHRAARHGGRLELVQM